ncbi:MAG TPA: VCBS repeat-containing protein [Kofleriaceae bacterium]|nr:VCBS repeat-containing protein [Kofleriaceae bacterium]
MRLRTTSFGLVLALASVAGCGDEEMFKLQIGANERMIDKVAAARVAHSDQGLDLPIVVGDLDGDGIDDAVVRSAFITSGSDGKIAFGGAVYVLYGGSGVAGSIDLAGLPALIHVGAPSISTPPSGGVAAVGDIDGDGLADFVVSIDGIVGGCNPGMPYANDSPPVAGAWVVYGSATRLTGSREIKDVAALLSEPPACGRWNLAAGLGDIDGDGKADLAVSKQRGGLGDTYQVFVIYGRGQRLSGTVDLATAADATISEPGATGGLGGASAYRLGDVDGDGIADFVVRLPLDGNSLDARIVRGSATRLAGAVALPDIGRTRLPGADFCFFSDEAFAVALGDLDGDGADDFSLVNCERGTTHVFGPITNRVFYGSKAGLPAQLGAADAAATLAPSDGFWPSQLVAGDVDGDGIPDLIFADENLHDSNGGVHIIKGRHERLSGAIDPRSPTIVTYVGQSQRIPGCQGDHCVLPEKLGAGVSLGDLTGDHHPDLLIGANSDDYEIVPGPGTAMSHSYVLSSPVIPKP